MQNQIGFTVARKKVKMHLSLSSNSSSRILSSTLTSFLIFSTYTHALATRGPRRTESSLSLRGLSYPYNAVSSSKLLAPKNTALFLTGGGSQLRAFSSSSILSSPSSPSSTSLHSTTVTVTTPPPAVSVPPGSSPVESQETLNPIDETCTVLVVGATRGIGLDFVHQCIERGATVVATYRSEVPPSLQKLKSSIENEHENENEDNGNRNRNRLHFLKMDVSSEESIQNAALEYKQMMMMDSSSSSSSSSTTTGTWKPFTHIIHNAGIYLTGSSFDGTARGPRQAAPPVTKEIMMQTFEINTVAPLLIAQNFVPLTSKRSDTLLPVISFVSSKVGSVDDNGSGGAYAYRSSKSALNNIAKSLSIDLAGEASVILLHPGYVRTDMTGGNGLIDKDESVSGMLKAVEATDATVGFRFVDYKACLIPW